MSDALVKTTVGLRAEGDMPWEVWVAFGEQLRDIEGAVQWWIGDWLNYGEHAYGEKYAQAVSESQAKTWATYAYVARSVPMSIRMENVSWSKHQVVAPLSPEEQTRYLEMCSDEGTTVKQLRAAVKGPVEPAQAPETCSQCGQRLPARV